MTFPGKPMLLIALRKLGFTTTFGNILFHGLHLAAWCQGLLRSPAGRQLLQLDIARVGQGAAADLRSYSVALDG